MRRKRERQDWRDIVRADCAACLLPVPARDWPIHPPSSMIVSLAWPTYRVGVELDLETFASRQHIRRRRNRAAVLGWRLLTFSRREVLAGHAREAIQEIVASELQCTPPTVGPQAHMDQSSTVGPQVEVEP